MVQRTPPVETSLFAVDETAWLEQTAALVRDGRLLEVENGLLADYLSDMARRDRREVFSRLVTLLAHLLKWEHQPNRQTGSWKGTILEQQRELRQLFESATLTNHALAVLADAFADARKQAAAETELPRSTFPADCPWELETVLTAHGDAS